MLLGEVDLVHLLRSGRAGIKQSESQKRRQQHSQEAPTRGYRVPVSNERHGMVLHLAAAQGSPMFRLVNVSPKHARPGGENQSRIFLTAVPFAALMVLAGANLISLPASPWGHMIIGERWLRCLLSIPIIALFPFCILMLSD